MLQMRPIVVCQISEKMFTILFWREGGGRGVIAV
jgi:hypothetical protein